MMERNRLNGVEAESILRRRFAASGEIRARRASSSSPWLIAALGLLLSGAPLVAQEVPESPPANATETVLYSEKDWELPPEDIFAGLTSGKMEVSSARLYELGRDNPEMFAALVHVIHAPMCHLGYTQAEHLANMESDKPALFAVLKGTLAGAPDSEVSAMNAEAVFLGLASRRLKPDNARLQDLARASKELYPEIAAALLAPKTDSEYTLFQCVMGLEAGYPEDYAFLKSLTGAGEGEPIQQVSARLALRLFDRGRLNALAAEAPESFRRIYDVVEAPLSPELGSREAALAMLSACHEADFNTLRKKILQVPQEDDELLAKATNGDVYVGLVSGRWKVSSSACMALAEKDYDSFLRIVKAVRAPIAFGGYPMLDRLRDLEPDKLDALRNLLVPAGDGNARPGFLPRPAPCAP